jgi:deferrochelatase/peroxidase EfeB
VNPRHPDEERSHRIVRRGITYGERRVEPKDDPAQEDLPERGVGLLFMCFQASIDNQFAYLQRLANDSSDGLDPIIGQSASATGLGQTWPVQWGEPYVKPFEFTGFVRLRGGDFFFAPSLPFLRDPG